jgi:hypothetical protein
MRAVGYASSMPYYRKLLQARLRENVGEVANDDNGNKPTPSSAPQPRSRTIVAYGEVDAENAAIAPAHDVGPGDFQTVHQRDDVVGHQIVAVGLRIAGATAMAAAVHQNDGMMRRYGRNLAAPIVGIRQAAVQEDHWRGLAVDRIV